MEAKKSVELLHKEKLCLIEKNVKDLADLIVQIKELESYILLVYSDVDLSTLSLEQLEERTQDLLRLERLKADQRRLKRDADVPLYYFRVGRALASYYEQIKDSSTIVLAKRKKSHEQYCSDLTGIKTEDLQNPAPICPECNLELFLVVADSILVCQICGYSISTVTDSDRPAFKEPPQEKHYAGYKRRSRLKAYLDKLQGKETTAIPAEVYRVVDATIKHDGINPRFIREETIRKYLSLPVNKKYLRFRDHSFRIACHYTGIRPIRYTPEQEEAILNIADIIDPIYDEVKPYGRKTFQSYPHLARYICQMLGYPYEHIPVLKSKDPRLMQDVIFKQVCKRLGGSEAGWMCYSSF